MRGTGTPQTARMNKHAINVCVICGGTSAEAEVSRSSAREVARALRACFASVVTLELDASLPALLASMRPQVVFPVLHGPPGEDGTLQGFLETMGLPYVGSGVTASACAMNKHIAKQLFRTAHLPLVDDALLLRDQLRPGDAARIMQQFPEGAVVKPVDQGSALGVSFAQTRAELEIALDACFMLSTAALVERRIRGREITCAVLDLYGVRRALPVVEIRAVDGWYDYEHRYAAGASQHLIPAPLDEATTAGVQAVALRAHEVLGCRDLSRADFIVTEDGGICLLEVNTLPGMTATSLFPDAAAAAGIPFETLVRDLSLAAFNRRR